MSNVFPRGVLFIPFPAVVAETLPYLTPAEFRLYMALLTIAQKHTAFKLHLPAFLVHDYTGLHSETVGIAHRKLEKRDLIRCAKGTAGVTIYELLNPVTGDTLPPLVIAGRKFSGIYIYKSEDGRSSRTARSVPRVIGGPPATPPSWKELNHSEPSQSVSMTKPIRNGVTDSLVSGASEVHENVRVSKVQALSSEVPIRREVLNKEVGRESSGIEPKMVSVGERDGLEKQDWLVPTRNDAQQIAENSQAQPAHRAELVVLRMGEKFGTTIQSIIDKPPEHRKRQVEVALPKIPFVVPDVYMSKTELGQPRRCNVHGLTTWWTRADGNGTLICDRCHPSPMRLLPTNGTEV